MSEVAQKSLANLPLFAGLDAAELRSLEQHARWRTYKPGERVLESGSESRDVFFMLQGSASAVNYSFSGREVAFATFNAGEFFGELAALDAQPRSASVSAAPTSWPSPKRIVRSPSRHWNSRWSKGNSRATTAILPTERCARVVGTKSTHSRDTFPCKTAVSGRIQI